MSRRRKKPVGKPRPRVEPTAGTESAEVDLTAVLAAAAISAPRTLPAAQQASAVAAETPRGEPSPAPAGTLEAFVQRNAPEVVGVTVVFDPPETVPRAAVTVVVHGQRVATDGPADGPDVFRYEETLPTVVAGSGPVTATVKIRDVAPGQWRVRAEGYTAPAGQSGGRRSPIPVRVVRWSWRRWRLNDAEMTAVATCRAPLVPTPAVLLGSWLALVLTGMGLGLLTQALVTAALGLSAGHLLIASLGALFAGAVGAKAWYVLLHRRDGRADGWGIQGLVTGVLVVAPLLFWALGIPVGASLDATAPGLMFGMATGRLGCFLTGCCAGRPTASRWAIWSSNRQVAARRVPTQLLESSLAFLTGVGALAAVLIGGPHDATIFVAVLAVYTAIRQGLLLLREEPRQSRRGPVLIAASAAVVLLADLAVAALV